MNEDNVALINLLNYWQHASPGAPCFPTHSGMLTADFAKELAKEIEDLIESFDQRLKNLEELLAV